MAYLLILDGNGSSKFMLVTGEGTEKDPLVVEHKDSVAIAAIDKVKNCLASKPRATSFIDATANGIIKAGASSVAIANAGDAAGTVKGASLPVGASLNWGANGQDVLDAIPYDATGTVFLITTVV